MSPDASSYYVGLVRQRKQTLNVLLGVLHNQGMFASDLQLSSRVDWNDGDATLQGPNFRQAAAAQYQSLGLFGGLENP